MPLQKIVFVDNDGKKLTVDASQIDKGASLETVINRFFELEKKDAEENGARLVVAKIKTDKTDRLFNMGFIICLGAFTALVLLMLWCGKSYAVVPASTSLEEESRPETGQQKIAKIVNVLEHREEENIRFIEDIKNQLKELR